MDSNSHSSTMQQQSAAPQNARVIVAATVLGLGGIRTQLILLLKLLRRHGVEVIVFATEAHWDQETIASLERIGVRFRLPPAMIRESQKLSALYCVLTRPFRLPSSANSLYCIYPGNSQLLLHRLKPNGVASINHEIVGTPDPRNKVGKCAATLDCTVANSRRVTHEMKAIWPVKPIRDIPFLTSDAPLHPPDRLRLKSHQPVSVVYLGRFVEHKRPHQLVRRWPELTREGALRQAKLDIYGYDPDGKLLKDMREFVSANAIGDQVKVHGEYRLADLPGILDGADLVVLPSLDEGLPLVLVEAMLRGVPIVATAAGGTEELGDDNPDVIITSLKWADFEEGLIPMAAKMRAGEIDPVRSHRWAEKRYGYESVSQQWLACLLKPRQFFESYG